MQASLFGATAVRQGRELSALISLTLTFKRELRTLKINMDLSSWRTWDRGVKPDKRPTSLILMSYK